MKKLFLILFIFSSLFSFEINEKVEELIGKNSYKIYDKLIYRIFKKESYSIEEVVSKLINNGLLDIFLKNPEIIKTEFIFEEGNPIFQTKVLYDSLNSLGYYYFYPVDIKREDGLYSITIELQSEHFIDPLSLIKDMKSRGCLIDDLHRKRDKFIYSFDCENIKIKKTSSLSSKFKKLIYSNGVYWISANNFRKIVIYSNKYDFWHPYVVFYDENLNIIDIIDKKDIKREIVLSIDENCKYIKIMDNFSKTNIKRGIRIKGLK